MRVFTEESRSKTVAFSFADDQGVFRLAVVYENQPDIHLREKKSAFHQGSASFHVRGYRPAMFKGEYWTERKNVGTITVSERRRGEIDSYEQGVKLYDS
ncbi:hypothetical protein CW354_04595 [Marinicaulis flavus]|uniref:CD-NTase-associated protein 15 domain-containing protein n=2 Tax=Hyphococcus luteus TaxID=2058213 RepID=A0A2S7K9R4_9PROT|nr:hypothetical protein CW354_04595 [Marinicaulis flavus]